MKFINNLTLGLVICFAIFEIVVSNEDCLVSKFSYNLINTSLSHKDDKLLPASKAITESKNNNET